jgi:hypothetical protein
MDYVYMLENPPTVKAYMQVPWTVLDLFSKIYIHAFTSYQNTYFSYVIHHSLNITQDFSSDRASPPRQFVSIHAYAQTYLQICVIHVANALISKSTFVFHSQGRKLVSHLLYNILACHSLNLRSVGISHLSTTLITSVSIKMFDKLLATSLNCSTEPRKVRFT